MRWRWRDITYPATIFAVTRDSEGRKEEAKGESGIQINICAGKVEKGENVSPLIVFLFDKTSARALLLAIERSGLAILFLRSPSIASPFTPHFSLSLRKRG